MPSEKFKALMEKKRLEKLAQQSQSPPTQPNIPAPMQLTPEIIPDKEKVRRVAEMKKILYFLSKDNFPLSEIWDEWERSELISPLIKEVVVEVEKPLKTPPEKLELDRTHRLRMKVLAEEEEKAERDKKRIEIALKRKGGFCRFCLKGVACENPTYELVKRPNRQRTTIVILFSCPICHKSLRNYGGFL